MSYGTNVQRSQSFIQLKAASKSFLELSRQEKLSAPTWVFSISKATVADDILDIVIE